MNPCQHLVLSVFQILAILIGVQQYLVVLICVSQMTYDMEHFLHMLICHLHIFFGGASVKVFSPFFNPVVCFLVVELGFF